MSEQQYYFPNLPTDLKAGARGTPVISEFDQVREEARDAFQRAWDAGGGVGSQGPQGWQGLIGSGSQGNQGWQGLLGAGSQGFQGIAGVVGPVGTMEHTFYVAKNGDDSTGNGSASKPFLTVQKAFDSIVSLGTLTTGTNIAFLNTNPDKITRTAGDFVADGWVAGDRVTVLGSTSNNNTYTIANVSALELTLNQAVPKTVSTTIAFLNSNPDQITRSSGDFVADGWLAGQRVVVSGSTSNNGTYIIDTVSSGALTLIGSDMLVAEGSGPSVTLAIGDTDALTAEAAGDAVTLLRGEARHAIIVNPGKYIETLSFVNNGIVYLDLRGADIVGNITWNCNPAANYQAKFIIEGHDMRSGYPNYLSDVIDGNIIVVDTAPISKYTGLQLINTGVRGNINFTGASNGCIHHLFMSSAFWTGTLSTTNARCALYAWNCNTSGSYALGSVTDYVQFNELHNCYITGIWVPNHFGSTGGGNLTNVQFAAKAHNFTAYGTGNLTMDTISYASYMANVPTKGSLYTVLLTDNISPITSTAIGITLSAAHEFVAVTAASTIVLPSAVSNRGRIFTIKSNTSGTVTINTTSSQTIDGVTSKSLTSQYQLITVISDGANWFIMYQM